MKKNQLEGPLETAVRLLAIRDHTEKQLREKLRRKEFTHEEISETITQLKEKSYLSDEKFGQRMLEKLLTEGRYGLRAVMAKLRQAGLLQLSESTVRQHYSEEDEWETAIRLLEKKFSTQDASMIPRQVRFLTNRGFSQNIISKVAQECRKHQ